MKLDKINYCDSSTVQIDNGSKWEWIKIVGLSTLTAVIYGISNDLLQKDSCPEYWAIGHVYGDYNFVNAREQPIANAFIWGTLASWWVGAIAGVVVATASRAPLPFARGKVKAQELIRSLFTMVAIGLPLGQLVSQATKTIVANAIEHGANYGTSIPKAHYLYPNLSIDRQPDWFACAMRNNTGYLIGLISVVGITAKVIYDRYKQPREKEPFPIKSN